MKDYLNIGPCPGDEQAAQVGSPDYHQKARRECRIFINMLRRIHGEEPTGARLTIRAFDHEFGSYHEVVCYYDSDNKVSSEYALKCEGETPEHWDELALEELNS